MADRKHGRGVRGVAHGTSSSQLEGRFGRLFRTLEPAAFPEGALRKLGIEMTAAVDDGSPDEPDPEENSGISAGYTYLGQLIDHDLTFDPASITQRIKDQDALTDFRSPAFDLDCVYGRGPDDQPYMYAPDGVRLTLGRPLTGALLDPGARDHPRSTPSDGTTPRALIGDPRNDENRIVAQLHTAVARFHNLVCDTLDARDKVEPTFEKARQETLFHYQWLVLHDFLPTIVGKATTHAVAPHLALDGGKDRDVRHVPPDLRFFRPKRAAFMPYEFAVAAYRFGHSMVRPAYRLNATIEPRPIFTPNDAGPSDDASDLGGFRPIPGDWAIDWRYFFDFTAIPSVTPLTFGRLQPAYKIDTSLVHPLGDVPGFESDPPPALPTRNLLRGDRLRLPSGEDVANAMGQAPLARDAILIGKAADGEKRVPLHTFNPAFAHKTPLWVYVLAEAMQPFLQAARKAKTKAQKGAADAIPLTLGPVGGRIVAETIVGLMIADSTSYLRRQPLWTPELGFQRVEGEFGIADLLNAVALNPQPIPPGHTPLKP